MTSMESLARGRPIQSVSQLAVADARP